MQAEFLLNEQLCSSIISKDLPKQFGLWQAKYRSELSFYNQAGSSLINYK